MKYISTREFSSAVHKSTHSVTFKDTLFNGLAKDGGLYIPESIPLIDIELLERDYMDNCVKFTENIIPFAELAFQISRLYIDKNEIPDHHLKQIMIQSFSKFRSPVVTPLVKLEENVFILELFHGPTFAFKDIALQVLGNLFQYFLDKENSNKKQLTLICATSGDTGGAAIYSVAGKKDIECYVLHPKDKISNIQKAQMTTVTDDNIHNIEIDGTFDDCQSIVKDLFRDTQFKSETSLSTFNSINWARIMVQITYYFCTYFQLRALRRKYNKSQDFRLQFSVPTGNFGDILAGFYAKMMGLPVDKLIIATNSNNILYRFMKDGIYQPTETIQTLSPAMDITVPSNFERLLYYFQDPYTGDNLNFLMQNLMKNGIFSVSNRMLNNIRNIFSCETVSNKEILHTITDVFDKKKYLIDPHTAVGVCSIIKNNNYKSNEENSVVICLSTAHPGKFPNVINTILNEEMRDDFIPEILKNTLSLKQKYKSFDINKNILSNLKKYILDNIK